MFLETDGLKKYFQFIVGRLFASAKNPSREILHIVHFNTAYFYTTIMISMGPLPKMFGKIKQQKIQYLYLYCL